MRVSAFSSAAALCALAALVLGGGGWAAGAVPGGHAAHTAFPGVNGRIVFNDQNGTRPRPGGFQVSKIRLLMFGVVVAALLAVPGAAMAKSRDRDHDKLPDKWEKKFHLSTHRNNAKGDPDPHVVKVDRGTAERARVPIERMVSITP